MASTSTFSPPSRWLAAAIAVVAGGSIVLRVGLSLAEGETLGEIAWRLTSFFTILTNLLVMGTFARIAGGHTVLSRWILALAAAIAGVGLVYHALLAQMLEHHGWEIVADQGVHTAAPLLTVIWALAFLPATAVSMRDSAWVIAWPMLYCLYALLRGLMTGSYPYFFIDAGALTWPQMVTNIAGLTLFFFLLGVLLVAAIRARAWLRPDMAASA